MELPEVIRAYVDAYCRGDLDGCVAAFAPTGTYIAPGMSQPASGQAIKEQFALLFAGFPDLSCETVALERISESLSFWRWILRGTNTNAYRGLPPTGRSFTMHGCEFMEVQGDKLHWVEGYFDRLTLLTQLDLAPGATAPRAGA
jgi:hypothetical protein